MQIEYNRINITNFLLAALGFLGTDTSSTLSSETSEAGTLRLLKCFTLDVETAS
jgi:hypothetical protein